MTTLYKHRIYCNVTNGWVYKWTESETLLTVCPDDPAHAVQANSASIEDVRAENTVVLNKEPGNTTYGNVKAMNIVLAAAANSSVTITKTWLHNIAIYTTRAGIAASCIGCTLTLEAAPLTAVGVLTADAPAGTTVLNVSPTVTANITPGVIVTLQQGGTVQELGVAADVNAAAGTITVETATASNFAAAGPTVVRMTRRVAENLEMPVEGYLTFGEDRTKAVELAKGRPVAFTLVNPNPAPARLVVYMSYNY